MRLTIGQTHDLLIGLTALEQAPDVKLSGEARLAIAINIGRIRPVASAYERARTRVFGDLFAANRAAGPQARRSDAEINADAMDADETARSSDAGELDLRTLTRDELRLADNPKITGAMLAQIWPMLSGMD